MNIEALERDYLNGRLTPADVAAATHDHIAANPLNPVWLALVPRAQLLARANALATQDRARLPLYGIPFAVKDNIDVAGLPTTAACPAFAYTPSVSATVVQRLEAAGALLIGKTNMDQFATGLVGTRTPYGACSSVFSAAHISGGSSSGSAVAVASGQVAFALGTDTAGSGRVPAMFNNLVGLKPTRGVVSTAGVVPACRTLDCVSIFAETADDAARVLSVAAAPDPADPYSRTAAPGAGATPWAASSTFRFGVPAPAALEFFADALNPALFAQAREALIALGGTPVEFDVAPFLETARLLYQGPWVAERYAAIASFYDRHAAEMDPTVATILASAKNFTATDTFKAQYRLRALATQTAATWQHFDLMLLPTAPRTYTHAEIAAEPILRNSHLGYYTNFVNLLDLAAIAVPAGIRADGLPFGVSLIGPAFSEAGMLPLADRLQRQLSPRLGSSQRLIADTAPLALPPVPHGCLLMTVVGAHLSGQPLNWQLTQRGGRLLRTTRTAPDYRLYALANTTPPKPGLIRTPGFAGPGIEVEVWALPADTVGSFVDGVPQPLGIGKVQLADGSLATGFIAEPAALEGATDITHHGGWRAYLASQPKKA